MAIKKDHISFIIGIVAMLCLVYVYSNQTCEPNLTQRALLRMALSLSSALVATGITGRIIMNAPLLEKINIRAGGAIAIFALVFLVDPLKMPDEKIDKSFSERTCQGETPTGKIIKGNEILQKRDLPEDLIPSKGNILQSKEAFGRPVKFNFYYQFGPQAGIRDWSQVRRGVWIEMYPDSSMFTILREVERQSVDGCDGTIVTQQHSQQFKVFIPDIGCEMMWLRFQLNDNEGWQWLGKMNAIQ
ncbi:hypothetical protein [Aeromonas sp. AE23HZ002T15]